MPCGAPPRKSTEHKRADQQAERDLDAMTRLQRVGSLFMQKGNLEPVLTEIVDAAIAIVGADFGNIQLRDPASGDLRIKAHRGLPQWWLDFWDAVQQGQGACGTALERGERVIVEDVEQSPIFIGTPELDVQRRAGVRAVISTPLVSRSGEPLGMFSTHFKAPHRPDDRTLRLLDLLARQAADIIERAGNEETLRRSEEHFRRAIEEAPIPVIMHAEDGEVLQISRTWTDLTGYTIGDVRSFDEWTTHAVYGEGADEVRDHLRARFRSSSSSRIDFAIRTKAGEIRHWTFSSSVPGQLVDGRRFVVGMALDITEGKRAEEALRESQDRYRKLFGNMVNGFAYHKVIFGEKGRPADYEFEEVNSAFEKLVGLKSAELLGKRLSQVLLFLVKDPDEWTGAYGQVALTGREMEFELRADVLEKQFLISAYSPAKGHLAAIFEDVTARRLAERSLRESNAELEVVNRELEAFSFTVANDLRAPLRSIEGFTQALAEDYGERLDEGGRDYCRRINDGARRMNQLIDAMLSLARQTRGELTQNIVNLTAAAQSIAEELRAKQPNRQVRFAVAPDMKVMGDRDMLQVVLENLLDNAWKFTSKHPSANIEVGVTEIDGEKAYFVRDDGAGFDMAYAANLFGPFRRLHEDKEYPGIGIGLAIAHSIIKRHGGRMWAESEPEKGAVFYFTV